MVSKWDARKDDIQRMVEAGMTDEAIGVIWDASAPTICTVRKRFGILSRFKRKSRPMNEVFAAKDPAPEPLVGETYVDEAGLTVTRYPARWAEGALVQSVTARPRR